MPTSTADAKFEALIQAIAPHSKLLRTWPLQGGMSAAMTALEFEHPDGQKRKMIVRQPGQAALQRNPQIAANEFKLLQIMQSLGLATPTPYYLDQAGQIFSTPTLAMQYIEGKPEFVLVHRADFAQQMATHLAKFHRIDGSKLDLSFLPQQAKGYGAPPQEINHSLDEGRIRTTLAEVWPLQQHNASTLLHGDFWPGNLLWRDEKLVAVVDWEDAHLGDPLVDFAISRLDIVWIFGLDALHAFTDHYQSSMALDYTNLPYWDLYAALRLIRLAGADLAGWAAFFTPFGRSDITEQTIREHYKFFITQAFEKLAVR